MDKITVYIPITEENSIEKRTIFVEMVGIHNDNPAVLMEKKENVYVLTEEEMRVLLVNGIDFGMQIQRGLNRGLTIDSDWDKKQYIDILLK